MSNIIEDEFTHLNISKQQKYQLRKRATGVCRVCTRKAVSKLFCSIHLEAKRKQGMRYRGKQALTRKETNE